MARNAVTRAIVWTKDEPFGVEFAEVNLLPDRLSAAGVAIGTVPMPYRLAYTLETAAGFVTSRILVTARGAGWQRSLDLQRSEAGTWAAGFQEEGEVPFAHGSIDMAALAGALDCDLGTSPLTNSMPVLRHGLLTIGGPIDLRMAWISVPDLAVHASTQRYTFVRTDGHRTVFRYEATDGDFKAEITFDGDGLVVDYPGIGRVTGELGLA
jgi:hypothetical protein